MLSCLSYNIHYGKKLTQISSWVKNRTDIDIFCFQEFPFWQLESFLQTIGNPQLDYQFALGFKRGKKQFGQLTLFNKKKLKLRESEVVTLGTSFWEKNFHMHRDHTERSSLLTIFSYQKKDFLLANTHLVCLALNKRRKEQIKTLLAEVSSMEHAQSLPKVLLGDYNYSSKFHQKKLLEFMEENGFKNAYKQPTHRLFLVKHQIDYVFHNNCKIEDVNIKKLKFSDHFVIQFSLVF